MTTQHTQGPWVVKTTIIGPGASVKVIGRKDRDLSDQEMVCMVPQTNEEQVANTLLIAAAPDLLNAVRFLLSNPDNRISAADVNAARAAISKATGGAT